MQDLTDEKLLELVEKERKTFSSNYFPLHDQKLDAVKKCSDLVAKDRNSIHRNTPKLRAHMILTDIWTYLPEVFVLCSLATNPSRFGTLKSKDYLQKLIGWWEKADQPNGLRETVERLLEILPSRDKRTKQDDNPEQPASKRRRTQTSPNNAPESETGNSTYGATYGYRTKLEGVDLHSFMGKYQGHTSLVIRIPDDENESPSIEISREMCAELIKHAMESTRGRI